MNEKYQSRQDLKNEIAELKGKNMKLSSRNGTLYRLLTCAVAVIVIMAIL